MMIRHGTMGYNRMNTSQHSHCYSSAGVNNSDDDYDYVVYVWDNEDGDDDDDVLIGGSTHSLMKSRPIVCSDQDSRDPTS